MPKLYRFAKEDDILWGMYSAGAGIAMYDYEVSDPMSGYRLHPVPQNDSLLSDKMQGKWDSLQKYHFGFSSVAQARRWLYSNNLLRYMAGCGVVLYVLDIPEEHFVEGYTQAIARIDYRTNVTTYTIEQFINGEVE